MSMCRINVVAFDFLGHGDSPRPNQPELYTADEVFVIISMIKKDETGDPI